MWAEMWGPARGLMGFIPGSLKKILGGGLFFLSTFVCHFSAPSLLVFFTLSIPPPHRASNSLVYFSFTPFSAAFRFVLR